MTQKNIFQEFVSFLGVGVIATACHYILLICLVEFFGFGILIASTAGAVLGGFISYLLNYKITFQSGLAHTVALPKFVSVATFAIFMNWVLMKLLTQIFLLQYLLAQILTTVLLISITFGLNKIWSFKEDK